MSGEQKVDLSGVSTADLFEEAKKRPGLKLFRECLARKAFSFTSTDKEIIKLLVLDTETTGLDSKVDEVIEFAGVLVEVENETGRIGRVIDQYSGFQQPSTPIKPEITAINGITNEMVAGQKLDCEKITQLFESADLICAHNASFDRSMMDSFFDQFLDHGQKERVKTPWVCSNADIDWAGHGYVSAKLELLTLQNGFFHNAHRALDDVWALLYVIGSPMKDDSSMPAKSMIAQGANNSYFVQAVKADFDTKDVLKANGFSFDWDNKIWGKSVVGQEGLAQVHDFFANEIYNKANAVFWSYEIKPIDRFSRDLPERKVIPVFDPDHPFSSSAPAP